MKCPFNIGNYIYAPPFMNKMSMNKIYMCSNCKISFIFNECFDTINNKHYNEHCFKLKNYESNDNIIKGNNNADNNNDIKNNNIINDNFENDKKDDNNNENKKNEVIIKNNEKYNDEKEKEYYNVYVKFEYILENYFFKKNGKLKIEKPTENEKNVINGLYLDLMKKNINIKDIEEYQNNYILIEVNPLMKKLGVYYLSKFIVNRLDAIKILIKNCYN